MIAFVDLAKIQTRSKLMCDPDSVIRESDRTSIGLTLLVNFYRSRAPVTRICSNRSQKAPSVSLWRQALDICEFALVTIETTSCSKYRLVQLQVRERWTIDDAAGLDCPEVSHWPILPENVGALFGLDGNRK
jgi:hypothetical protein